MEVRCVCHGTSIKGDGGGGWRVRVRVWLASLVRGVGGLVFKKASTGGKVEETTVIHFLLHRRTVMNTFPMKTSTFATVL